MKALVLDQWINATLYLLSPTPAAMLSNLAGPPGPLDKGASPAAPFLPLSTVAAWPPNILALRIFGRDDAIVGSIGGTLDSLDVPVNFLAWDTLWRAHPTASEDGISSLHSMDS